MRVTRRSNRTSRDLHSTARVVVDFVLDYVERAGRISGAHGKRVLELPGGSLHFPSGALTGHVDTITRDVERIIAGQATYAKDHVATYKRVGARADQRAMRPLAVERRASAITGRGARPSRRQRTHA